MIDPSTAFRSLSERREISEDLLVGAAIVRWALVEASDESVFRSKVQDEGRPYAAWLTQIETYAPNSFLSRQHFLQELVNIVS